MDVYTYLLVRDHFPHANLDVIVRDITRVMMFSLQAPKYTTFDTWYRSFIQMSRLATGGWVCRVQKGKQLNDFQRNLLDIEILSNLRFGSLEVRDTSVTRVTNNFWAKTRKEHF